MRTILCMSYTARSWTNKLDLRFKAEVSVEDLLSCWGRDKALDWRKVTEEKPQPSLPRELFVALWEEKAVTHRVPICL